MQRNRAYPDVADGALHLHPHTLGGGSSRAHASRIQSMPSDCRKQSVSESIRNTERRKRLCRPATNRSDAGSGCVTGLDSRMLYRCKIKCESAGNCGQRGVRRKPTRSDLCRPGIASTAPSGGISRWHRQSIHARSQMARTTTTRKPAKDALPMQVTPSKRAALTQVGARNPCTVNGESERSADCLTTCRPEPTSAAGVATGHQHQVRTAGKTADSRERPASGQVV